DILNNLELWEKVCTTDPNITKNFKGKGGFQGTAICAQSQRKKATEIFGIFGIGWKIENENYNIVSFSDDHYSKLFYTADLIFKYKDETGIFPIASEIDAMVFAVNIPPHEPAFGHATFSIFFNSSSEI
ncbi:hypothetical protein LCGC14_2487420, partial [marine sediment metagenome]